MQITTEVLETQIEVWTNEKHQTLAKINYLEGAIQSYRVLISQMDNENEEGNNAVTSRNSQTENKAGKDTPGSDEQDRSDVGDVAGKAKSKAQAKS